MNMRLPQIFFLRLPLRVILLIASLSLFVTAPVRAQMPYDNSVSISLGAYAASGFGTNFSYGARYNYFISGGKFFIEGALSFGSLKSQVLENITRSQVFDTDRLYTYEFVAGIDPYPNGYTPYLVVGVAGLNQGGQSNFAGVLGLGKRVPLKGLFGGDRLGFRYDVRDQIFSQRIMNNDPFISHNIVFTLGLQLYF
ncbi:MAG: hypothetical protein KF749_06620 [Bacteroidetes bacterium]|nr:hypothetical protein [Bacteroidota bacterium]MCW5896906.1 hypothetical protein [Bacteroidota bacterium]